MYGAQRTSRRWPLTPPRVVVGAPNCTAGRDQSTRHTERDTDLRDRPAAQASARDVDPAAVRDCARAAAWAPVARARAAARRLDAPPAEPMVTRAHRRRVHLHEPANRGWADQQRNTRVDSAYERAQVPASAHALDRAWGAPVTCDDALHPARCKRLQHNTRHNFCTYEESAGEQLLGVAARLGPVDLQGRLIARASVVL